MSKKQIVILICLVIILIVTILGFYLKNKEISQNNQPVNYEQSKNITKNINNSVVNSGNIPFELTLQSPINYHKDDSTGEYYINGRISELDSTAQQMFKGNVVTKYFSVGSGIGVYVKTDTIFSGSRLIEGVNLNTGSKIKGYFDIYKLKFYAMDVQNTNSQ